MWLTSRNYCIHFIGCERNNCCGVASIKTISVAFGVILISRGASLKVTYNAIWITDNSNRPGCITSFSPFSPIIHYWPDLRPTYFQCAAVLWTRGFPISLRRFPLRSHGHTYLFHCILISSLPNLLKYPSWITYSKYPFQYRKNCDATKYQPSEYLFRNIHSSITGFKVPSNLKKWLTLNGLIILLWPDEVWCWFSWVRRRWRKTLRSWRLLLLKLGDLNGRVQGQVLLCSLISCNRLVKDIGRWRSNGSSVESSSNSEQTLKKQVSYCPFL